jgi:hypothetical protein
MEEGGLAGHPTAARYSHKIFAETDNVSPSPARGRDGVRADNIAVPPH